MDTIKITCPECKHQMEYWTRNNFINCTKCKASIPVEPCVENVDEVIEEGIEIIEVNVQFICTIWTNNALGSADDNMPHN